ncbi:MAG: hypothetical protein ACREFU_20065 [Acetobacteraceae bacterium]
MKRLLAAPFAAALLAGTAAVNAATVASQSPQSADVPVTATVAHGHTNSVAPRNVNLATQTGGAR